MYLISMKSPVYSLASVYYGKRMRTSSIVNWVHTNGLWGASDWGFKLHNDESLLCMIASWEGNSVKGLDKFSMLRNIDTYLWIRA